MIDTKKIAGCLPANARAAFAKYEPYLDQVLIKYEINTPLRQAHFLAQLAHESGYFRFTSENLKYTASSLQRVFGKYFPTPALAQRYALQPQMIANRVYADRMGNGNEASGDGWKYRGKGLIQLTGKANYEAYSKDSGNDFVVNPDLVASPLWALDSAGWFWKKRNLNMHADKDDVGAVTKLINGGFNGLKEREHCLQLFKAALGATAPVL